MDEFLILLQAKLDEAKSKGNVNADIKVLQSKLDKLRIQAELDPKAAQKLADSIGKLINQKIIISNIGIDTNAGIKAGQEYGKQVSQGISQGMSSASKSTEKVLRDFSELNDAKRKFVDRHDLISKDDIADAERLYDTVRKAFSEFGQVTVSKGSINDGSLENMRVKIEQVNGEMKITRDFMLYFNESKNGFKLVDDDTIRTTEKMVQHLNEEKNIINATNEEANAIKAKLAEQEKYYKNIKNEVNNLYNLKTKLLSADELQTAELEKQIKQTKERISYNNKQIDKKDLRDNSLERQINDLEVAKQKQLDLASAKSQDAVNTKELTQAEREAATALKERQTLEAQVNKIQLSMTDKSEPKDNYNLQIKKQIAQLKSLGLTDEEVTAKTKVLTDAHAELKQVIESTNYNSVNDKNQAILSADEKRTTALNQVKNAYEQAKIAYDKYMQPVTNEKATSLINRINTFLSKNTKITKDARIELEGYVQELNKGVNLNRWNEISGKLKETENSMRGLHRLGLSFKNQMSQAMSSFSMWFSASSLVMKFISQTREAVSELKEVNTILTEISKTSNLTKDQLKAVGNASFETASKYGNKASDYLLGVQEMYRAGYQNAEELAELSTLAQSAGDLDADLANDYILASDAAYRYSGNIEKLNLLLDSQNQVTNRNAVSMEELANATKVAASQLANSNISENEMTALLGTGIATTKEAGEVVGRAVKGIIMNLQQVEGETGFEAEVIDEESLKKVEARCHSVGVELEYMKDGIAHLRDPIDVLKELAEVYNSLPDDSTEKAGILSDIGGKYRSNVLSSILSNWDKYEKMLSDYENASGSAMEEAMKSANNWEGSLNRLSNTWTDTVGNIANSDAIITIINSFNNLLNVLNKVTNSLGSLGSIGLGAGLFAGLKNVGSPKMSGLITV